MDTNATPPTTPPAIPPLLVAPLPPEPPSLSSSPVDVAIHLVEAQASQDWLIMVQVWSFPQGGQGGADDSHCTHRLKREDDEEGKERPGSEAIVCVCVCLKKSDK